MWTLLSSLGSAVQHSAVLHTTLQALHYSMLQIMCIILPGAPARQQPGTASILTLMHFSLPSSRDGKPLTSSSQARPPGGAAGKGAGSCPLRSLPGVLGGLVPLSAKGELTCPQAVVAARAFVAKMKPVRDLRPQALPVKVNRGGGSTAYGRTLWRSQAETCAGDAAHTLPVKSRSMTEWQGILPLHTCKPAVCAPGSAC